MFSGAIEILAPYAEKLPAAPQGCGEWVLPDKREEACLKRKLKRLYDAIRSFRVQDALYLNGQTPFTSLGLV